VDGNSGDRRRPEWPSQTDSVSQSKTGHKTSHLIPDDDSRSLLPGFPDLPSISFRLRSKDFQRPESPASRAMSPAAGRNALCRCHPPSQAEIHLPFFLRCANYNIDGKVDTCYGRCS
jgi:hypothetical protein